MTLWCVLLLTLWGGSRAWRRYSQDLRSQNAQAAIQQEGATIVRSERRVIRGGYELKDVWRVEFPDGVDDLKLTSLIPHLAAIPRLDLNLRASAVTDASVGALGYFPNLVAIDLSDTTVTNAGLDNFYRLHSIEVIELTGTRIGDEAVSMCAMNGHLHVLVLDRTRVSNASMLNLRVCNSLTYLSVANTRVNDEGERILSGAIGGVTINRQPSERAEAP